MLINSIGQSTAFNARLFINGSEIKKTPKFIKNYEKLVHPNNTTPGVFSIRTFRPNPQTNSGVERIDTLSYNNMIYHEYYNSSYVKILKDMKERILNGRPLSY